MTLPIQEALEGKYEILEKIGEGGIGSVYKVKHRLLEEVRVIKVLRPQAAAKEDLQERFVHEARMAIRLKQANIAQLHDFSVTPDGTAYIVMEFIDGVGLDSLLRATGPPSIELVVEVSCQALTALGYLHAHRFVHRDVSPDNLMLTRDYDGSPLVKLIDLGIAKNLEGEMQLTATGVFVGKVRYSSPEQFSAQGGGDEIDHRSDIYSFGVMLYELLTGQMPVGGESFSEVAGGHLFHPPRSFDETDPEGRLSGELRAVVLQALEKEPDKRFASTEDFIAALRPFAGSAADLTKELKKRLRKTRTTLPQLADAKRPGSTQNRLDAEFGLVTTPSPSVITEVADSVTTAAPTEDLKAVAAGIDNLIRSGKLAKAEKALAKAAGAFGEIRPIADLRSQLATARKSSPGAATGARGKLIPIAGAAVILLAALGTWLAIGRGGDESPQIADGTNVEIPAAPARWGEEGPVAGEGHLFFDREAPSPPVIEGERPEAREEPVREPSQEPPPGPRPEVDPGRPPPQGPPPGGPQADRPTRRPGGGGPPPPARTTTEIYTAGAVGVVPPVLVQLPEAVYPLDRPPKNDVVYVVTVLIDEFGQPTNPSIKRGPSFGRARVKDAAIEVAMGARFRPAVKGGVAGRMWKDVQVVFPGTG